MATIGLDVQAVRSVYGNMVGNSSLEDRGGGMTSDIKVFALTGCQRINIVCF